MKIGIFSNEYQDKEVIRNILNILIRKGVEVFLQKDFHKYLSTCVDLNKQIRYITDPDDLGLDMVFSIGGDGTFLKAVSVIRKKKIPILGINTGRLGFLADVAYGEVEQTVDEILRGEYRIEERSQIKLIRNHGGRTKTSYALNEVAILKQDLASMITVTMYINGEMLSSYEADGLIVSTPTGSTAYSLSVGGAIMAPNTSTFIITAIAPHSLTSRPLVVEDDNILTMEVQSRSSCFLASVDGHSKTVPVAHTQLRIEKAEEPILVVKRKGQTFYNTLRNKLKWGVDPRQNNG